MADQAFGIIDPEDDADVLALARKKALAQSLMQASLQQQDPTQTAGKYVVPFSPMQGLAQLGKSFLGSQLSKQADTEQSALKQGMLSKRMALVRQLDPTLSPEMVGSIASIQGGPEELMKAKIKPAPEPKLGSDTMQEFGEYKKTHPEAAIEEFLKVKGSMGASSQPNLQPFLGSDGKMYSFNNRTGAFAPAKGLDKGTTATRPNATSGNTMTPDAIDEAAATWRLTGTPPVGYGRSPGVLAKIANRKAELDLADGDAAGAAASKQVANKAGQKALADITQRSVLLEANANNAENNFQTIEKLSAKVDRTGSPLINHLRQAFQSKVVQDPDLAAFKNAVSEGTTEYAKVVTGQTTGQAVSDAANAQMQKLLNSADSPQAFAKELATMREFIGNRKAGYAKEKQELLQSFQPQAAPPSAPPSSPKAPLTPAEQAELQALRAKHGRAR